MEIKRPRSKQPIPAHAKRVFKGHIFDVYQWQQKLFDGSFATFEKIKRLDTVNVLPVTGEEKIILTEQEQPGKKPFIGAAGGRIDEGEGPIEAAHRELFEETGYTAEELILWDSVQPISTIDWAIYTFIAKGCRQVADPKPDAGEKIKLRYFSFAEFIALVSNENYRDFEIAIKILRAKENPEELEKIHRLFIG